MEKQIIRTDNAPAPVGLYNQAIAASGKMLFCSGQIAIDPSTNTILDGDVQAQTKQVMTNLEAVLVLTVHVWLNFDVPKRNEPKRLFILGFCVVVKSASGSIKDKIACFPRLIAFTSFSHSWMSM